MPQTREKPKPRKVTPARLENAAVHYLERFATSAENLRAVLMRRVWRSARVHDTDPEDGARMVDALIGRYLDAGLLNDRAYADMRVRALNGRGNAARVIRAKLAAKGVAADIIEAALEGLRDTAAEPELAAAVNLARRRRLGPFRPIEAREANRDRDLAALARAGFGYDTARRVIEAASADDLQEPLA